MKRLLNKALAKIGYKIIKLEPPRKSESGLNPAAAGDLKKSTLATVENYHKLYKTPRYQKTIAFLNGKHFIASDAPSFCASFDEIFVHEIYKFKPSNNAPIIIDCGSNHGLSISYFKLQYPNSKITGIEADPNVFELLKANIETFGFDQVTLINKAISTSTDCVSFYCEGADGGRIHLLENAKNMVLIETLKLDSIIGETVDFLKIDIEGAEVDVVCSSEKLKNIDNIFIEYHSFSDTNQELDKILKKLSSNGFRYYIQTQFCSPRPFVQELTHMGMDLQLNIFAINSATKSIRNA